MNAGVEAGRDLPDEATLALRRHQQLEERLRVGPGYAPYELVFCT